MPLMYLILLVALGIAGVLLFVLLVCLAKDYICCPSPSSTSVEDAEMRAISEIPDNLEERVRLTSRPSAPHLDVSTFELLDESQWSETVRLQQTKLLKKKSSCEEDGVPCNMVIGVAANSSFFGGYCVNTKAQCVEYYALEVKHLPWLGLADKSDCSEFEMKNLLFALMLWADDIVDARRVRVHTANNAITYDNNRFGRRAAKLMEHYSGCAGISIVNDGRVHLNRADPEFLEAFAKYIQPAVDLSVYDFAGFEYFVPKYYGIDLQQFKGSHILPALRNAQDYITVDFSTRFHHEFIDRVRDCMRNWTEPCPKCGYVDDETASMLSINRIS